MGDLRFEGRVVIITGAGRGLGRSHALGFASRGAKVVVNDVAEESAAGVVEQIHGDGAAALLHIGDVATEEGAQSLIDAANEAFGRVDVIVNNAGILRDRSFKNISVEEWDRVLAVHLRGAFLVSRAAFPQLREYGFGRIVNTTSLSGLFGNFGQSNYSAAKMGVVGLTKTLAIEGVKYDVNVNAIAPIAYTQMTEGFLPAEAATELSPERVTPLVLWLSHEDCPTTGEVYSVGGGRIARVFIAEGPGVLLGKATAEDIQDNWPDINAERPYVIPRNLAEQIEIHHRRILR